MTWLAGWGYRKSHVINYAAGAGTLYQKMITVHYGSGTDGDDDVYLNSHCRTDFGDVRFTGNDQVTLLDCWMESKVDSDYAVFWVEVADDLSTVAATIYVYYGKADAMTTSNGDNTFIQYHGDATASFTDPNIALGTQIRFKAYAKVTSTTNFIMIGVHSSDDLNRLWLQSRNTDAVKKLVTKKDGTTTEVSEAPAISVNVWHMWEILYKTTEAHGYVDNDEVSTGSTTNLPTANMGLTLWLYGTTTGEQAWSFVSKYVSPEPAHGSWGSEETEEAPPPSAGILAQVI